MQEIAKNWIEGSAPCHGKPCYTTVWNVRRAVLPTASGTRLCATCATTGASFATEKRDSAECGKTRAGASNRGCMAGAWP